MLLSSIKNKKIILASKSPRRSQLLREAGFQFTIKTLEVEENYPDDLPVEEVAGYLAQKKARAAAGFIENKEIVLAADSIVIVDNTIFGKPVDEADATKMLRALSGRIHSVISGVCLLSKEQEKVFSVVSKVEVMPLTEEEIAFYIKEFQPFDKAGAYAIQEWFGKCRIAQIEGSYTNIVGLPLSQVYEALKEF